MKKKAALMLALAMGVTSLAGCGGDAGTQEGSTASSEAGSESSMEDPAAEESASAEKGGG